jgi:hypothetical protein
MREGLYLAGHRGSFYREAPIDRQPSIANDYVTSSQLRNGWFGES